MSLKSITIIIPAYNEESSLRSIYSTVNDSVKDLEYDFIFLFVNDGSTDSTDKVLQQLKIEDARVQILEFTRNFGKEAAVTAGIRSSQGAACIIIDADLQHPPEFIPEFIKKWEAGAEVVVGVRDNNNGEGFVKRHGSSMFYKLMALLSDTPITPKATDYRLLDRAVIDAFSELRERNRMTRALIDWLGFKETFIHFKADERYAGKSPYSNLKLVKLAVASVVSFSLFPLRVAGYLGILITFLSSILGIFIALNKYVFADPFGYKFTGTALLTTIIIFFIGIILICLGLIALYIANIHDEVVNRPMYVVRNKN